MQPSLFHRKDLELFKPRPAVFWSVCSQLWQHRAVLKRVNNLPLESGPDSAASGLFSPTPLPSSGHFHRPAQDSKRLKAKQTHLLSTAAFLSRQSSPAPLHPHLQPDFPSAASLGSHQRSPACFCGWENPGSFPRDANAEVAVLKQTWVVSPRWRRWRGTN